MRGVAREGVLYALESGRRALKDRVSRESGAIHWPGLFLAFEMHDRVGAGVSHVHRIALDSDRRGDRAHCSHRAFEFDLDVGRVGEGEFAFDDLATDLFDEGAIRLVLDAFGTVRVSPFADDIFLRFIGKGGAGEDERSQGDSNGG